MSLETNVPKSGQATSFSLTGVSSEFLSATSGYQVGLGLEREGGGGGMERERERERERTGRHREREHTVC